MKPTRASRPRRIFNRLLTVLQLLAYFVNRQRYFFVPLILILLLAGLLLIATEGLSYVAPFVYTLF